MDVVFDVTDPRGKQVICTQDCWNNHILEARSWMDGWEEYVAKAIEKPTFGIYEDANRPERNIYYLLHTKRDRYIKVVVSFDNEDKGVVITAFPSDNMKAGEKLIWTASDQ